jgi:hypothetical protein
MPPMAFSSKCLPAGLGHGWIHRVALPEWGFERCATADSVLFGMSIVLFNIGIWRFKYD